MTGMYTYRIVSLHRPLFMYGLVDVSTNICRAEYVFFSQPFATCLTTLETRGAVFRIWDYFEPVVARSYLDNV